MIQGRPNRAPAGDPAWSTRHGGCDVQHQLQQRAIHRIGRTTAKGVVHHHAQRVHIAWGPNLGIDAAGLLGACPGQRPQDLSGRGHGREGVPVIARARPKLSTHGFPLAITRTLEGLRSR